MGKLAVRKLNGFKRESGFQKAIEAAEALTLSQRESLVDILNKRNSQARRLELEAEIQESLAEIEQGKAKHGTLDELFEDLDL